MKRFGKMVLAGVILSILAVNFCCKIEHVISTESFAAIKKHIDLDSME